MHSLCRISQVDEALRLQLVPQPFRHDSSCQLNVAGHTRGLAGCQSDRLDLREEEGELHANRPANTQAISQKQAHQPYAIPRVACVLTRA